MDSTNCKIYAGEKFTVEWYYDENGRSVAHEFFEKAPAELRYKFIRLVERMGNFGVIPDKRKFRDEGDGINAFKPQPDRYLSFFAKGKKVIITNGYTKKTDKMPKNEKEFAVKCKKDYERRNRR